mgnify:CR=1 FL=1
MDAKEIIAFIQNAEKKTPVKVYLKEKKPVAFPDCKVFGIDSRVISGDWNTFADGASVRPGARGPPVRSILRILGRPKEGAERYPPRSNAALAGCFAMTPSVYNDTPVRSSERTSEG